VAITVVGLLEADLPGAIEYKSGGIGPLFGEARTEEPLSLDELLSRIVRVLRKAGLTSVVTVFIDETEAYVNDNAGDDNLDAALNITRDAIDLESGTSFYLMLTHEGDDLSHVITVEGSVDHPSEEAALSILDTARLVDGGGAEEEDEEEGDDEEAPGQAAAPVSTVEPPAVATTGASPVIASAASCPFASGSTCSSIPVPRSSSYPPWPPTGCMRTTHRRPASSPASAGSRARS